MRSDLSRWGRWTELAALAILTIARERLVDRAGADLADGQRDQIAALGKALGEIRELVARGLQRLDRHDGDRIVDRLVGVAQLLDRRVRACELQLHLLRYRLQTKRLVGEGDGVPLGLRPSVREFPLQCRGLRFRLSPALGGVR